MERGVRQPSDRQDGRDRDADLATLIPYLLTQRAIYPVYQPIVDLATTDLVGVEALARGPAGSPVEFPDTLFAAAVHAGLVSLLDQLCAARAIEDARDAGQLTPPLVFVNAEPVVLDQAFTPDLVAAITSQRSFRIVLEFTERALADHPAVLLDIAGGVHRGGDALALDDVGTDPLSLAMLPLIEPEVVKLDMHLLRHPHAPHTIHTATVASGYAERCGAIVLAEGIETPQDLATAQALGARWGQGWLFGRPGPLTALAGRPVHPDARLRPPQPGLHLPAGTPYTIAAAGHPPRPGDQPMLSALTAHLLATAAGSGPDTVILGAYPDPTIGHQWLSRLKPVAHTAALVSLAGPTLSGDPHPVRLTTPTDATPSRETTLAVVSPHTTVALCVRPTDPTDTTASELQIVLTHNPDLVHAVARTLLRRVDTATARVPSALLDPPVTSTTVGGSPERVDADARARIETELHDHLDNAQSIRGGR